MWGKDCNMQICRQVGKAVSVSAKASPERGLQTPDCTCRGSCRCCVISGIQSSMVCAHCHLLSVTARLHFMNHFLFYQEHPEILTCIAKLLLINQSILLQKVLTLPINISGRNY